MTTDPMTYILAAGLLGGCLGFISACILNSRQIRRAEMEGWKSAVRFYQSRQP